VKRQVVKALALSLAVVIVSAPQALALVTPERVLTMDALQFYPSGTTAYLAYTSNSLAHPKRWNAIAYDRAGGTTRKLNETGTQGFTGGFDPGTNTVIFQQRTDKGSALYLYDVDAAARTKVPDVNSAAWEWDPRISTKYVTFFRDEYVASTYKTRIYMYVRSSGRQRVLKTYPISKDTSLHNGVVGERYATWTRCAAGTCSAFLYDAAQSTVRTIPTVNGKPQYAAVVDEANGFVYYIRSGFGCGVSVALWRLPLENLGSAPVKIAVLPDGIDTDGYASFAPNPDTGAQDLLFTHIKCKGSTDIWSFPGLIPPPPP